MTVQQLKYILKVAEVGSITEAAKLLFISQPSLSNSIKETEKEAGITIFLRSRTGITLTKDGAEFLGYARQVIQQMELLEDRYVTNLPGYRTNGLCCRIYVLFSGFAVFGAGYCNNRNDRNLYLDWLGRTDSEVLSAVFPCY